MCASVSQSALCNVLCTFCTHICQAIVSVRASHVRDCECSSRGLYNACTRFRKISPFKKSSRRLQQQMECRIAGRNTDKRSTLTTPSAMEVRPRCTLCTCTPMVPAGISRLIMHTNADHGEDGAEAEPCQVRSKITMRQFLEIFAKWRMAQ